MPVRKEVGNFLTGVKKAFQQKGMRYSVGVTIKTVIYDWVKELFLYQYYKTFRSSRTFKFRGETYHYFYHVYNMTWKNERTVEIPIICKVVTKYCGKRILEVGNVLSHYFQVNHDILDKYDKTRGLINQDVVDFNPPQKYDLIISISTLEHVGWDEKPREPMKILRATENLRSLIVSGGRIIVTLPLGYNTELDGLIIEGKLPFTEWYFMKRISRDNRWVEVDWIDVRKAKYAGPFLGSDCIVIGVIE